MRINPLIRAKAELTHGSRSHAPVVLSSRVRLARNLTEFPFPGWANKAQRCEVLALCFEAVEQLPRMKRGSRFAVEELSELERQILVERHLISRELSTTKKNAGVVISRDQSCAIMINEEDHLRIQIVGNGFNFRRIWRSINYLDNMIEKRLDYAFASELGYLTACPTNVGTGLRASAMMHLPALIFSSQMEKVIRAVSQLGIVVRGLFGEGSDSSGSIFQISNQQTLGESEWEIIKRLTNVLISIIDQEKNARQKLLETQPERILDKICRAYGILMNVHILSSEEAMKLLSLLRLAVDLGMLKESYREQIDRLFIEVQPGHVQFAAQKEIDAVERDVLRARFIRDQFKNLPVLNFDKLGNIT